MDFWFFVLTAAVALAGGVLGVKLKLPAGALVGAMVGVIVLNLTVGRSHFYPNLRVCLQLLSGAMIGSKIGRKELRELKAIILPTVFLLFGVVVLNLVFGSLIYKFSNLDVTTSLFAIAPGGITDMSLVAGDMGGDTTVVAILQLFRVLIVFIFMPPLFRRILKKRYNPLGGPLPEVEITSDDDVTPEELTSHAPAKASYSYISDAPQAGAARPRRSNTAAATAVNTRFAAGFAGWLRGGFAALAARIKSFGPRLLAQKKLFLVLGIAAAGGMAMRLLGVPAGAITGSMVFSAMFCVWKGCVAFPGWTKVFVQAMFGGAIGVSIDKERLMMMPELLVPALIMLVGIFAFVAGTAIVMYKVFKLDLAVSLLASTPAGVQEMAFLSDDLGADTPKIAVMHTARLIFVVLVFPTMLSIVSGIIG